MADLLLPQDGGSYERLKDGSLKLTSPATQMPAPVAEPQPTKPEAHKPTQVTESK